MTAASAPSDQSEVPEIAARQARVGGVGAGPGARELSPCRCVRIWATPTSTPPWRRSSWPPRSQGLPGSTSSRPAPTGSRSIFCRVGAGCGGHLAPVHRCARSVCCVCGVLGLLAPVHRCARSVCCVVSWVSLATWLLCTGVHVRCALCAVSLASWFLFADVPAQFVLLRVRCRWPLGSCLPVRPLDVLCCAFGVLGHLAPVHRYARSVCCVLRSASLATWLLFTSVRARYVVLRVRCPWPLGACSPVCSCGVFCVVCCGVLRFSVSVVVLSCARRARAPYAFSAWCVFLGVVVVAWHLVLCLGCGRRCASLARLVAPCWCEVPPPVRSLSVRRSALPSPWCLPQPGARALGFIGRLPGARGGRPRTGLMVPAAGPRRGGGAGLDPRRTCSGPRDGVVPGWSLRRWSRAACAAMVLRVLTRSLKRPVSRTVRLSTGTQPVHRGCFV